METNHIIEELRAISALDWNPEQKAYYEKRASDARPVECVRMRDALTKEQLEYLSYCGYRTQQKMCYRNSAELVRLLGFGQDSREIKYVEGYAYSCGLLPIEHAFVKIGDKYIDPTFERALHKDVRKEMYVSLREFDVWEMAQLQAETGYYGDLYQYAYLKENRLEIAALIAHRNIK